MHAKYILEEMNNHLRELGLEEVDTVQETVYLNLEELGSETANYMKENFGHKEESFEDFFHVSITSLDELGSFVSVIHLDDEMFFSVVSLCDEDDDMDNDPIEFKFRKIQ